MNMVTALFIVGSLVATMANASSITDKVQDLKKALGANSVSEKSQRSRAVTVSSASDRQILAQYNEAVHSRSSKRNKIALNAKFIPSPGILQEKRVRLIATIQAVEPFKNYYLQLQGSFASRPEVKAKAEAIENALQAIVDLNRGDDLKLGYDTTGVNDCGHKELLILILDRAQQIVHAIETEACEL